MHEKALSRVSFDILALIEWNEEFFYIMVKKNSNNKHGIVGCVYSL